VKVSILGSEGYTNQISRVRDAFVQLGHEHTFRHWEDDVDLIFVGDPCRKMDEVIQDKIDGQVRGKVIFNVLDCPLHLMERGAWNPEKLCRQLAYADAVTSISKWTQGVVKTLTGFDSSVVYYPMKDVFHTGQVKYPQYKAMLVGRLNDTNKRTDLAIEALIRAGYQESEVAMVGSERPRWGDYLGVVTDEVLNDLYNSVDFVLMPSRVEGIGLSAIEGAICGAIPILCSDLPTLNEFWQRSPWRIYYDLDAFEYIVWVMRNRNFMRTKPEMREYAQREFFPKFNKLAVAKRIIEVYQKL
jgi:glycosyltransferase involved in cell wall biosynthesis